TRLWNPEPSVNFNWVSRQFAETIAESVGVAIDRGVYDKVRPFRAPNSRHPKTGHYKRRLTFDELLGLSLDGILKFSEGPESFDLPTPSYQSDQAAADWREASRLVEEKAEANAKRATAGRGVPTLNRLTLEFIRYGAD